MKVRKERQLKKASIIFTDREEPRKVFWDSLERFTQGDGETIQVLSYYGIGGIGKSCLLRKLMQEMEEKADTLDYVYYDLKLSQESHVVLDSLKNQLKGDSKIDFPLFELGLYVYYRKIGLKPDSLEVKKLTDQSKVLKMLISLLGKVPVISIATEIFSLAEQGLAVVLTYVKQHRKELAEIELLDAHQLHDYLPFLFAQDLSHSLKTNNEKLVVFLDTYEYLVNELSGLGEPLLNDAWIRSENGLIQNTSNVLWVIAGREKLKWEQFDPGWHDSLEQHILGNLSFKDATWFLEQSNITDEQLRKDLYGLTNGTPVYLDLCVARYYRLLEDGIVPTIEMFGQNKIELVERFARYMSDAQKDLVYLLAVLKRWNDDMIMEIAPKVLHSFSISTYEKCKEYSFVELLDEEMRIHETVGSILADYCPSLIRKKTSEHALKYYLDIINDENTTVSDLTKALSSVIDHVLAVCEDEEQLLEFVEQTMDSQLEKIVLSSNILEAEKICTKIRNHARKVGYRELESSVLMTYANLLMLAGYSDRAVMIAKSSLFIVNEIHGEESVETLKAMNMLALCLVDCKKVKEAGELFHRINSLIPKVKGLDNQFELTFIAAYAQYLHGAGDIESAKRQYLKVMERLDEFTNEAKIIVGNNLAHFSLDINAVENALEISELCFNESLSLYGENHAITLNTASVYASACDEAGDFEKAMSLNAVVYTKRREMLGKNHPDTLLSLNNYALLCLNHEQHQEGFELLYEAYHEAKELYSDGHPVLLGIKDNLAYAYAWFGEIEEALELNREVYNAYKSLLPENHPTLLDCEEKIRVLEVELCKREMTRS